MEEGSATMRGQEEKKKSDNVKTGDRKNRGLKNGMGGKGRKRERLGRMRDERSGEE